MSDLAEQMVLSGDSGGSKTDWRLLTLDGKVQQRFTLDGMAALHRGLLPCTDIARVAATRCAVVPQLVYLVLGGPNEDEVREALQAAFPASRVVVEREAEGSLLEFAAETLDFQAVVMAGTGVTAIGFDANGRRYAEGWGPTYGDRASGGGIGTEALRLFLLGVDRLETSGRLPELFSRELEGVDTATFAGRMELKKRIHMLSRKSLAALAPAVMRLAEEGDQAASRIIAETADRLGAIAAVVVPDGGRLLWLGGLFRLGESFRNACETALRKRRSKDGCSGYYDERISLGKIAAVRALSLSQGCLAHIKEVFYGD